MKMNNLFNEMQEGEVYSTISLREQDWFNLKKELDQDGIAYAHHYNKQVNELYEHSEELKQLYREKHRINKEISKIEQYLNGKQN